MEAPTPPNRSDHHTAEGLTKSESHGLSATHRSESSIPAFHVIFRAECVIDDPNRRGQAEGSRQTREAAQHD